MNIYHKVTSSHKSTIVLESSCGGDKKSIEWKNLNDQLDPFPQYTSVLMDTMRLSDIHILLVEDDVVSQVSTAGMLRKMGCAVTVAGDGLQAITALESGDYNLVFMDCSLPEMDGFEVTRIVRSAKNLTIDRHIPIIALTGLARVTERERCASAGMDHCLGKPVDSAALTEAIEQCLGRISLVDPAKPQDDQAAIPRGDGGFLDTLLDTFLGEVSTTVADLQQALRQSDFARLQSVGHRMRGAGGLLGVQELSNIAWALEQAGQAGDMDLATRYTLKLIAEVQRLAENLNQHEGKPDPSRG